MAYSDDKYKLRKMAQRAKSNDFEIFKEYLARRRLGKFNKKLIAPIHSWKRIHDYSVADWVDIQDYYTWIFEWSQLPKRIIPFIYVEPIFKFQNSASISLLRTTKLWQVMDVDGTSDNKKVRLVIGAWQESSDIVYKIEGRIICQIINPEVFE